MTEVERFVAQPEGGGIVSGPCSFGAVGRCSVHGWFASASPAAQAAHAVAFAARTNAPPVEHWCGSCETPHLIVPPSPAGLREDILLLADAVIGGSGYKPHREAAVRVRRGLQDAALLDEPVPPKPKRKRRPTYVDEEGVRRTDYSQEPR